jgi:LysM repeat protein
LLSFFDDHLIVIISLSFYLRGTKMEGGYLPWKNQKIDNNCPPVEYFSQTLPPPPSGLFWERSDEGNWNLMSLAQHTKEDGTVVFNQPSIVEHTVLPNDTLQGLCLRYGCSLVNVRRMNMFSGNNIQVKSKLLIPINAGIAITPQIETEEVLLQRFKNLTNEGNEEARLYLTENNWKLDAAVNAWKADSQWEQQERQHSHERAGVPEFSSEISDVVTPFAIENANIVQAVAVVYSPPTLDLMSQYHIILPEDFQPGVLEPLIQK